MCMIMLEVVSQHTESTPSRYGFPRVAIHRPITPQGGAHAPLYRVLHFYDYNYCKIDNMLSLCYMYVYILYILYPLSYILYMLYPLSIY